ncbi:DUF4177 domain-containing protein [Maribacter sp. 2307ULW6-5]|uniref:DUF4177 domain-containing protein n=1 Tax=Maribacter sp. 2307ULW6-5 TaxID=3386275 RepID=UPI0039BCFD37
MKEYKVASFLLYSKLTLDSKHILNDSTERIQELLDEHAAQGWSLVSTDASKFGYAMYYYLYFQRTR